MTTKKKPAAKRAKKTVVVIAPNPITVGSLVTFKGAKSPVMTVVMLSAEYVGPVEHKTAHLSWVEAGVVNSGVVRLDELDFVCTQAERMNAVDEYQQAEHENARHDFHVREAAEKQRLIAAQAAEQEKKGAV